MHPAYSPLPAAPLDPIMQANLLWPAMRQQHVNAINTTIGVLIDSRTGQAWKPAAWFNARDQAQREIDVNFEYGYQSQVGNALFLQGLANVVFGSDLHQKLSNDLVAVQSLGGTGALSLAAHTASKIISADIASNKIPLIFDNGWPNHPNVFTVTFSNAYDLHTYVRTSDSAENHQASLELIKNAPALSLVLLQACGYNDDGLDRTTAQWDEIIDVLVAKNLPVIIDSAYLGLANGLVADRYPIEQTVKKGLLTFITASCSKNMGLYNERLGALFIANAGLHLGIDQQARLKQAVNKIVRGIYSSPPLLTAKAVGIMLHEPNLRASYIKELGDMQAELVAKRLALAKILGPSFPSVATGRGLFTKLLQHGFSDQQTAFLQEQGILSLQNSRFNIGGIMVSDIDKVGATIVNALSKSQ